MLTTDEKIAITNKKRNLKGTNLNIGNSFATLDDSDIVDKSNMMGVRIDPDNFAAINLIKDLKIAIHALNNKADNQATAIPEEVSFWWNG